MADLALLNHSTRKGPKEKKNRMKGRKRRRGELQKGHEFILKITEGIMKLLRESTHVLGSIKTNSTKGVANEGRLRVR